MINLTSGIKFRKIILLSVPETEFSLSLQEGLIFIMYNRENLNFFFLREKSKSTGIRK